MKSPAFQFYTNNWLGSTKIMLMTPAEEGAYIRLLAYMWNSSDCGLEDDDEQLAILSRLNEGWFKGGSTKIKVCFIKKGNRLYSERLLIEREKQKKWREKSSKGGKKSAKLREESQEKNFKGGSRVVQPPYQPKGNIESESESESDIDIDIDIDIDSEKERGDKSPTPAEQTMLFINSIIGRKDPYNQLLESLYEKTKIDKDTIARELDKFVSYWTERNKNGTKERWQIEKTFEIQRRLSTWFDNLKSFRKNSYERKGTIIS